jgi:hypothetical protein
MGDISFGSSGMNAVNNYVNAIETNLSAQSNYLSNIQQKNQVILDKQNIQLNQLKEIEDKEKLLLTRSRMLQIAQDRNSYKKKIIYTLLAIIFGLFILILFVYVLFTRKMRTVQ